MVTEDLAKPAQVQNSGTYGAEPSLRARQEINAQFGG
jgi:hypothetical protein